MVIPLKAGRILGGETMGNVASSMSMSLDGFVTGPHDSRERPLGEGGEVLHD
jgi:hypothetical protein